MTFKMKIKTVLINHIIYPVKNLGFGNRVGIWFQGCTIHCKGCMAKYTWDFDDKYKMTYEEVYKELKKYSKHKPYGVTISGGEPFDQPEGLLNVLDICHELNFNEILVYSGYNFDYLTNKYPKILSMIDILISEPFIEELPTKKIWRGSDNQKLHILSHRCKERYKGIDLDSLCYEGEPSIQVEIFDDSVLIIGIPRRGDLEKLKEYLKYRGVYIWEK